MFQLLYKPNKTLLTVAWDSILLRVTGLLYLGVVLLMSQTTYI